MQPGVRNVPVGRLPTFVGRTVEPIVTVLTAWFRCLPSPLDSPRILRLMEVTFFLRLLSRVAITLRIVNHSRRFATKWAGASLVGTGWGESASQLFLYAFRHVLLQAPKNLDRVNPLGKMCSVQRRRNSTPLYTTFSRSPFLDLSVDLVLCPH
jgi:hypothetical protein